MSEHDYQSFITLCNETTVNCSRVLELARILSSPEKSASDSRRVLLNMSEYCPDPGWEHLYRSRLIFDLDQPEIVHYNPATAFVSLNIAAFHPLDPSSAPDRVVKSKLKFSNITHEARNLVHKMIQDIATSLPTTYAECASKLHFKGRSHFHLFGIPSTSRSSTMAYRHLTNMGHRGRQTIVMLLLDEFVSNGTKSNQTPVVDCLMAKRVHKRAMKRQKHTRTKEPDNTSRRNPAKRTPRSDRWVNNHYATHTDDSLSDANFDDSQSDNTNQTTPHISTKRKNNHEEPTTAADTVVDGQRGTFTIPEILTITMPTRMARTRNSLHAKFPTLDQYHIWDQIYLNTVLYSRLKQPIEPDHDTSIAHGYYYLDDLLRPTFSGLCDVTNNSQYSLAGLADSVLLPPVPSPNASENLQGDNPRGPIAFHINDALSPQLKRMVLQSVDDAVFIEGRDGRKDSFLRIATTEGEYCNVFFHTGRHLYPATPANECERTILKVANALLCEQNKVMLRNTPEHSALFLSKVNTLQIMIESINAGSGYGKHSDYGDLINNSGDFNAPKIPAGLLEGCQTPYREEMQTITFVLTSLPIGKKDLPTHNLRFYDLDDKDLGGFATASNTMHFQMHGTQCYRHGIRIHPRLSSRIYNGHVRIVLSCRYTPALSRSALKSLLKIDDLRTILIPRREYKFTNVVSTINTLDGVSTIEATTPISPPETEEGIPASLAADSTKPGCRGHEDQLATNETTTDETHLLTTDDTRSQLSYPSDASIDTDIESTTPGRNYVQKKFLRDNYPQAPPPSLTGIHQITRAPRWSKGYSSYSYLFLTRGDVSGPLLLSHGVLSFMVGDTKTGRTLPTFFRAPIPSSPSRLCLLRPLQVIDISRLAKSAGIPRTSRSSPPTCGDHTATNVIILSRPYKNDLPCIQRLLDQLRDCSDGKVTGNNRDIQFTHLTVYGSGGSPSEACSYANQLKLRSKYEPNEYAPSPQTCFQSSQNRTMLSLTERRGVVAVFIDLDRFSSYLDKDSLPQNSKENAALFLGYYYFDSATYGPIDTSQLAELNRLSSTLEKKISKSQLLEYGKYAKFRAESHFQFHLQPVFKSCTDLNKAHEIDALAPDYGLDEIGFQSNTSKAIVTTHKPTNLDCPAIIDTKDDSIFSQGEIASSTFIGNFIKNLGLPTVQPTQSRRYIDDHLRTQSIVDPNNPITPNVLLHHLCCVNVSGAIRYRRINIYKNKEHPEGYALPIPTTYKLPTIYRSHPMPMAIRSYDYTTIRLIQCAVDLGLMHTRGDSYELCDKSLIDADFLFMTIFNRMTGRHNVNDVHRTMFSASQASLLPTRDEAAHLLDFAAENDCHSKLFNTQHLEQIPNQLRRSHATLREFLKSISDSCEELLNNVTTRAKFVNALTTCMLRSYAGARNHLSDRNSNDLKKFQFLSSQVASDLEEVFCQPFGDDEADHFTVIGPGSKQGLDLFVESNPCLFQHHTEQPHDSNGTHMAQHTMYEQLAASHRSIVHAILTTPHDDRQMILGMLGCELDSGSNTIVVAINRRPLSISDTEHFMCKLHIGISKTLPGRSDARNPQLSRAGYHPYFIHEDSELSADDPVATIILTRSIQEYTRALERQSDGRRSFLHRTPNSLLLIGENDPLI